MRLKTLLLPLLFLTLKDGNSLTVALSIPPPREESGVEWSGVAPRGWAGVAANCLVPPIFLGGVGGAFVRQHRVSAHFKFQMWALRSGEIFYSLV